MFPKLLILYFLFFLSSVALSAELRSFPYVIKVGDTFSSILKQFVLDTSIINAKTPIVKKIISANPQVVDWANLKPGVEIELFVSDVFFDKNKFESYKNVLDKLNLEKAIKQQEVEKNIALEQLRLRQKRLGEFPSLSDDRSGKAFRASVFFMSSLGIFTQKSPTFAEIQYHQDSPVSLGGAFSFPLSWKNTWLSGSVYYSQLHDLNIDLTNESISVPAEIGGNIYGEYHFDQYNFNAYSGFDYDHFSAFNLKGISQNLKVYVDQVQLGYLTLGFSKSFTILNKKFFSKIAISPSIFSTYKNAYSAFDQPSSKYSGVRFLFYLKYDINNKFFIHSLFKYHSLTGPSDLKALRMGVGVGYVIF